MRQVRKIVKRGGPALELAIAAYVYVVSVGFSALAVHYARLDDGLESRLGPVVAWQALRYGAWLPIAYWLWLLFQRRGVSRAGLLAWAATGMVAVPAHAATAGALSVYFSPYLGRDDLTRQIFETAPISLLVYCAIAVALMLGAMRKRAVAAEALGSELAAALDEARRSASEGQAAGEETEMLMVSVGRRRVPVAVNEVEWFSSAGNYVVVNWTKQEGLIRETLQSLEKRLPSQIFARVHRTTIVNLSRVTETASLSDGSWRLCLQSGMEVVASRSYRDKVLQRLGRRPNSDA
ncbi:MAG TPA: LytTR family DNA-binding domain-containing protein [Allosphingosinicella sp.]|nr:LytTR family DNA-binding domain-containing protein [Allosphingosinicella sp.]